MGDARLKPTILSISLLTIMASAAVSPALAKISEAFPGTDPTVIKLILTLPSLFIIPFSLQSGWLVSRVKKRTLLLAGLAIYIAGGIGAGFGQSITQVLVIRGLFGIGVGIIMPLSTTLIIDFFEDPARVRMMGLSGSVTNLGGVIFLTVSGWLACVSWRYSFGVYLLAIVTFIMVMLWLPEPQARQAGEKSPVRIPMPLYGTAVLGALMMIAFYAVPTNLALFIESEQPLFTSERPFFGNREELLRHVEQGTISENARAMFRDNNIDLSPGARIKVESPGRRWRIEDSERNYFVEKLPDRLAVNAERLGRPAIAGYALGSMTLGGVVSGILLNPAMRLLGAFCVPLSLLLMGIGFFMLGQAPSLWMIFAAVPFIGLSAGILMPSIMLRVPKLVDEKSRTLAMAIVGSAIFLGQFLSPIALRGAAMLFGNDTFRFRFALIAAGLVLAAGIGAVVSLIAVIKRKRAGMVRGG